MSEQINLDVHAVLNTEDLYTQLSQIRPRINVDINTSQISSQIQAAVAQASASVVPVTIPAASPYSSVTSLPAYAASSPGSQPLGEQSSGMQSFASKGMGALNTVSTLVGGFTALEKIGSKLQLPTLSESLD